MPSTRVTIIDYELGNVGSVRNAFESIGADVCVSNRYSDLAQADALVLPGVGAFADGIGNLQRLKLVDPLTELVLEQKKPFLGICLGMQLLAKHGFENGEHPGLGWIDADAVRFEEQMQLKVPHVGWNDVRSLRSNPLTGELGTTRCFYFVHSYHLLCRDQQDIIGTCNYGIDFPAAIQRANIFATQFHPEKSQKDGLNILRCFLEQAKKSQGFASLHEVQRPRC